jgi:hypothetical protein
LIVPLLLILPEVVVPWFFIVVAVLFGWVMSALRLVRECQPTIGAAFVFVVAVGALIAGTHYFISWLIRNWGGETNFPRLTEWRWKWTVCGIGIVVCSVLAISALILTTHQIYWLAKSSDPFFVDPWSERRNVPGMAIAIKEEADACSWNPSRVHQLITNNHESRFFLEIVDPILVEKDGNAIQAIVLVARHPLAQSGAKLAVVRPGMTNSILPVEELANVLASFKPGKSASR